MRVIRRAEQMATYIVDEKGDFVAQVIKEGLVAERFCASEDLLEACKLALYAFEKNSAINWEVLKRAIDKAESPCHSTNISSVQ